MAGDEIVLTEGGAAGKADKPHSRAVIDAALAALRGGNAAKARMLMHDRLIEDPDDAQALAVMAEIAVDDGQYDQATVFLWRAANAEPAPHRHAALGRHMHKYGTPGIVLEEIESVPAAIRSEPAIMTIEAAAAGLIGDHDRQIEVYEQLTSRFPGNPNLWRSLGNALKTVGRVEEAVAVLRRAIEARPTFGDAYWSLANFKSFEFSESDIDAMERALNQNLSAEDALHMHFALGKAYEGSTQFEASFRHYAAGNAIRAASGKSQAASTSHFVDRAVQTLRPGFFAGDAVPQGTEARPIFIVGMHRSGSTLIEQILASHPLVEATTELAIMNQIRNRIRRDSKTRGMDYWQALSTMKGGEFQEIGQQYLDRTLPYRTMGRPCFIDKMPSNWMNLPLIRLALPNAIVIDARRHPMACGFSNFKQNYASGATYTCRLETMGQYYRDYRRFMRQYDSIDPGFVHRVINERLIENPEAQIRALLDHCGLPFDPACLEFHNNKRAVRTPSAEQVRRPINREGVDSWRHYEQWLDPLKAALGEALQDWEK